MKTGRVDHHIVEMLAADAAMIHDHDVARRKSVEAVARNSVFHGGPEVGEENRQPAPVLRNHPPGRIEQPAAIIPHLVNHHVVGGLRQHIGHFVRIRNNGVAHDLDRHRMRIAHAAAAPGR